MLVLLSLLTGLAYPFAMTGLARTLFPKQAAGSLIERDGQVIGSSLIGQSFTSDQYFHGRPSATVTTDPADASKTIAAPYNAGNSSGSNAGPTAKSLIDRVQGDVDLLKKENPGVPVPVDLVTTSASGIDPHISPAAADFQVPRIARTRGIAEDKLRALVAEQTEPRFLGVLGEPVVNVLELNLALDKAVPYTAPAKPAAAEPAATPEAAKPDAAAKP
jgi:K+-transporting ATPase ATPase C chain